jgi:predicted membrane protein
MLIFLSLFSIYMILSILLIAIALFLVYRLFIKGDSEKSLVLFKKAAAKSPEPWNVIQKNAPENVRFGEVAVDEMPADARAAAELGKLPVIRMIIDNEIIEYQGSVSVNGLRKFIASA